jgi:fumarylacetoacetate (FAA) hydrolase family protein
MIPFLSCDYAKVEERIVYYAQSTAFRVLSRIALGATGRRQALAKRQLAAWLHGASLSDLRRMAMAADEVKQITL